MGHEEQPLPQSWQDWTPSAVKWYNLCVKSWNEIRKAATAFAKRWKDAYDEKSQAQSFLKEFFAEFGVDAVTVATFGVPGGQDP